MRITGIGHAGLFIETVAGNVLCDPWVSPAFFGSWFPFPDNSGLDWDVLGRADYLYVSHLHRDHFDAELLSRHVRKDATVLLPDYPTDELQRELADLGFRDFLRTRSGVPVERAGLRIMITSLTGPSDGPIGDSALSLDDGRTVLLNQNDAHPLDIEALREFGEVHGYFTQFSGAIWWPMVYELPQGAKREFARRKRAGQSDRALRYIDAVGAAHVFPTAGPGVSWTRTCSTSTETVSTGRASSPIRRVERRPTRGIGAPLAAGHRRGVRRSSLHTDPRAAHGR